MQRVFSFRILCLLGLLLPGGILRAPGQTTVGLVKDINPTDGSYPTALTPFNGELYFTAHTDAYGQELWKTNGTEEGTQLVEDIIPGNGSSGPTDLTVYQDLLFFTVRNSAYLGELWRTDGTHTESAMDLIPLVGDFSVGLETVYQDLLYFTTYDPAQGGALWKTNGTPEGTVRVANLEISDPVAYNGWLYFAATDGTHDRELWRTDGTHTELVMDIRVGESGSSPYNFMVANGLLFFRADDGIHNTELWKTDGTNTTLVRDLNPGSGNSDPSDLTVYNGVLYFVAQTAATGEELWRSDGTEKGTYIVRQTRPGGNGSEPRYLTVYNGLLYFTAIDDERGFELWKTDGTETGTVRVKDIYPGGGSALPRHLTVHNGWLYFAATDGTHGRELWRSDGTEAGTVLVRDIYPGGGESQPDELTAANGVLYFVATDGTTGRELYRLVAPPPPCDARVAAPPLTPANACPGQPLAVNFSLAGSCPSPPTGTFAVQLSSATGSFANPTSLGYARPGTTNLPLPTGLALGSGYRVRIVSGGQTSAASMPFQVGGPSLSVTPTVGNTPVCRGSGQVSVNFNLPTSSCPFPGGNTFTAQLSSATGSFNNPTNLGPVLPGQANSLTIPASVATGTGYRIRVVSSNPALTSANSGLFQVRACTSRLSAEEAQLVVSPNPVVGGEIRVRVSGLDNPAFGLTTAGGRTMGLTAQTDGSGEWVLTPRERLAAGVYLLQAAQGDARLTQRVLVAE